MKRLAIVGVAALLVSGAAASLSQAAEPATKLLGDPTPVAAGERVIVIQPGTKFVNVTGGEAVKFVVGDQTFAWDFDTAAQSVSFDLSRIAPAGVVDHPVRVYLARNPDYSGA
jgi:hypothetical protein